MKPDGRTTLTAIILLFAGACATAPVPRDILLDVPFIPQQPEQCGAAALEMILRRIGAPVDSPKLADKVFVPILHGATPELLVAAARKSGLKAEKTAGDLLFLRNLLAKDVPPIVFLGPAAGQTNGHFSVVTGIGRGQRGVRMHSGTDADTWIPARKFVELWRRGGYTVVVVEKE